MAQAQRYLVGADSVRDRFKTAEDIQESRCPCRSELAREHLDPAAEGGSRASSLLQKDPV